jgi:hypothetical protein
MLEMQTTLTNAMREFLVKRNFVEIHTPKLIAAASESGSDVFEVKYFDGKAYLAQSPQFYKQMAMAAGLERIFETGPVFRAEKSYTNKHATEFTGFDLEFSYIESFDDVMKMEEELLAYALEKVAEKHGEEIKAQFMPENSPTTSNTATTDVVVAEAAYVEIDENADEECALTVPAEDGERGEFTCLNEKTYSYLLPKNPDFVDEGDCGAAEIHQAYGCGREINYERDAVFYFSIAPEFDCEIKESGAKTAYTRYDSAPTRSKLMTVKHPLFTHAYLFDTPKKYRITYLKQLDECELLGCELILRKSGGDDAWKEMMIEEFKRFAGSCREV